MRLVPVAPAPVAPALVSTLVLVHPRTGRRVWLEGSRGRYVVTGPWLPHPNIYTSFPCACEMAEGYVD